MRVKISYGVELDQIPEEVQKLLPDDITILEYLVGDERTVLFILKIERTVL